MTTEIGRVELLLSSDSRLLAGASGAVSHLGEAAGLGENARSELAAIVEDACREALAHATKEDHRVALILELLPGCIEAVLEYRETPGAPEVAASSAQNALRLRLDAARRELRNGLTRLTLVKKIPAARR